MPPKVAQRLVDFIPTHAYPAPIKRKETAAFLAKLLSDETAARANRVIAERSQQLRDVVLSYVAALESALAQSSIELIYEEAHEIRGLAETIGLVATGRIAGGLCNYLDALERGNVAPDPKVIALHVEAIARAARAEDDATQHGTRVTEELSALVAHKLGGLKLERAAF